MKKIHKIFVCAVLAFLIAGLMRTVAFPQAMNRYENRYANQMPAVSAASFRDGSFQEGVDSALMDQIPLAQKMKAGYHLGTRGFLRLALDGVWNSVGLGEEQYVNVHNMRLFGKNTLTFWTQWLYQQQEPLDRKIASLNKTFASHPELNFYVYYIEKDTDLDLQTGDRCGLGDYLLSGLTIPAEHKAVFTVRDFHQFSQDFYHTDTHWNYHGADRGYQQLTELLQSPGRLLRPTEDPVLIGTRFIGAKAIIIGAEKVFHEDFYAYRYLFPPMTVTIDGMPAKDYGAQSRYLSGREKETPSYGGFYGEDNGETVFSTGTKGRGNLLVIGDSFDNAVLKLLAAHYDTLYSVDLRYYAHSMGQPFRLGDYTKDHGIDQVLLIGNLEYYTQDVFDVEG